MPIGILPVSLTSADAEGSVNCLAVHGRMRCSLSELAAAHESHDLINWIQEQPLYGPTVGTHGEVPAAPPGAASEASNYMAAADLHVVAQPDMQAIGDAAAFRASASLCRVTVNHRSADGLLLRSAPLEVLNNLTGLQFKSKVISAFELGGGFQHYLMSLDGQSFGSRVPLFTHTSFRDGCVVEIEDIGDRPKASGHT